jgi:hypothetical protein
LVSIAQTEYLKPLVEAATHNIELIVEDGTPEIAGLHVGNGGKMAPGAGAATTPATRLVVEVADLVGETGGAESADFY